MSLLKTVNGVVNDSTRLTKEYADHEYEHLKLKVFYHLAKILVGSSKRLALGIFLLLFLFFNSLALAFYLGTVTGSTAIGFLLTSGVYLVLGLIIFLFRKKIEKYLVNKLSENYFEV